MNPQVVRMFNEFYGTPEKEVLSVQNKFYRHFFQETKAIKIVAVIDDKVVGFTSFAYWPYKRNSVIYNSYQVGNAMIHPDYRGKGIFPRLLKYIDDHNQNLGVDFLFAFPHITASYPSFIRSAYINPFDLVWGIKIINPFAFLCNYKNILKKFSSSPAEVEEKESLFYRLERTKEFDDWFFNSRSEDNYAYFNFTDGVNKVTFYLKSNRRGKWINELIIGDIRMNNDNSIVLEKAFSTFFTMVKKSMSVSIISIAYNEHLKNYRNSIISRKFRKIKPIIHFVYRNYLTEIDLSNGADWELYRGDLDTW
ncbi:MAG: GNAT family N-acetyltransferase [Ginsengibacter sp.]